MLFSNEPAVLLLYAGKPVEQPIQGTSLRRAVNTPCSWCRTPPPAAGTSPAASSGTRPRPPPVPFAPVASPSPAVKQFFDAHPPPADEPGADPAQQEAAKAVRGADDPSGDRWWPPSRPSSSSSTARPGTSRSADDADLLYAENTQRDVLVHVSHQRDLRAGVRALVQGEVALRTLDLRPPRSAARRLRAAPSRLPGGPGPHLRGRDRRGRGRAGRQPDPADHGGPARPAAPGDLRRRTAVQGHRGHLARLRGEHADIGHPGRRELLGLRAGGLVRGVFAQGPLDRQRQAPARHRPGPAQRAGLQHEVRLRVPVDARDRVRGLPARLHGDVPVLRHRGLRHGLRLPALHRTRRVLPAADDLRLQRVLQPLGRVWIRIRLRVALLLLRHAFRSGLRPRLVGPSRLPTLPAPVSGRLVQTASGLPPPVPGIRPSSPAAGRLPPAPQWLSARSRRPPSRGATARRRRLEQQHLRSPGEPGPQRRPGPAHLEPARALPTNRPNNVYADKKGNVYRQNEGGSWDRNTAQGWKQQPKRSSFRHAARARPSQQAARPSHPRPALPRARPPALGRDAAARQRSASPPSRIPRPGRPATQRWRGHGGGGGGGR